MVVRVISRLAVCSTALVLSACAHVPPGEQPSVSDHHAAADATPAWSSAHGSAGLRLPAEESQALAEANAPAEAESPEVVLASFEESAEDAGHSPPPAAEEPIESAPLVEEETSIDAEGGFTLEHLEAIAQENNPTVRQAIAIVQQAEGNWVQVGLYPNPVFGYAAEEVGNEGTAGLQGGYLTQTIVTGGKLELNRSVACQDLERARWQLQTQRLRVRNEVRIRFYQALGAEQTVALARELRELAKQGLSASEQRLRVQEVGRADVIQSEIQLNQIDLSRQNAELRAEAARQQLANVVGLPFVTEPLIGTLDESIPELEFETAWNDVVSNSPQIKIARVQIQRARAQLRREQAQPIPDVLTQTTVQYDSMSDDTVVASQVGIALPIHNRNQGSRKAASGELRRSAYDLERLELSLRDQLTAAFQRYLTARNNAERYRDELIPRAEENLRLTSTAYDLGEFDLLRVLTARQTLFETRMQYINALTDVRKAVVEIEGQLLTDGLNDPSNDGTGTMTSVNGASTLTETPKTQ